MQFFLPASHLPGMLIKDRLHLKASEMWRQNPDQRGFMLSSSLRAKSLWKAAGKFSGESMNRVILSKNPLETPISVWLLDSGPAPGPWLWFSQAHSSNRAEIWSGAATPLQGTGNFAQAFQRRAQPGSSSFPLVASIGSNLQPEPPARNKGDVICLS